MPRKKTLRQWYEQYKETHTGWSDFSCLSAAVHKRKFSKRDINKILKEEVDPDDFPFQSLEEIADWLYEHSKG